MRPIYLIIAKQVKDLGPSAAYERRRLPLNEYTMAIRTRYPELHNYMVPAVDVYLTLRARGAEAVRTKDYEAYRLRRNQRSIEIYLNTPSEEGLKTGLMELGRILDGVRVHTVIGRGHTVIINRLHTDVEKLLGPRKNDVAMVIVGACGGTASLREVVDTFGYRTIVSTRASGRLVINTAIIDTYLSMLFALDEGDTLDTNVLLGRAVAPFVQARVDERLRADAQFYQINTAGVYAAMLFDRHVRGIPPAAPTAPPAAQRSKIAWQRSTESGVGKSVSRTSAIVRKARASQGDSGN